MRKLLLPLTALVIWAVIHEGGHILTAIPFGEYEAFHVRPYGLEVTFRTAVEARSGIHWAFISGTSNVITVILGYLLLPAVTRHANPQRFFSALGYWLVLFLLLFDPLNIAIGPFVYGGDALGLATGLGVGVYVVQAVFFLLFLVNREVIAQRLLPAFEIETKHPLFRPWLALD